MKNISIQLHCHLTVLTRNPLVRQKVDYKRQKIPVLDNIELDLGLLKVKYDEDEIQNYDFGTVVLGAAMEKASGM